MNNNQIPRIKNYFQDKNSVAWQKLCEYIDKVAIENKEEFAPCEELGVELYSQILTLPKSISKLKKVKKMCLYGSNLISIPPEIGEMEDLEYFDPYTSYYLRWFPYEITNCKKLVDSRVSTRALFGNPKNKKLFPNLQKNPIRYDGEEVNCSICRKSITYDLTSQYWISQRVGTDVLPLLANTCSDECLSILSNSTQQGFVHKGGIDIKFPTYKDLTETKTIIIKTSEIENANQSNKEPKLLRFIKKIWEK
jgi:hypothetical protein